MKSIVNINELNANQRNMALAIQYGISLLSEVKYYIQLKCQNKIQVHSVFTHVNREVILLKQNITLKSFLKKFEKKKQEICYPRVISRLQRGCTFFL